MAKGVPLSVKRHAYAGWSEAGRLQLRRLRGATNRSIGIVLVCHLQIEHYLDHLLRVLTEGDLNFEGAALSFNQKVKLLSRDGSPLMDLHLLIGIRELNALRNRLSHDLEHRPTKASVAGMRAALHSRFRGHGSTPTDVFKVVEVFTVMAVASLVSYVAAFEAVKNPVVSAALIRQRDKTAEAQVPANRALQPTSRDPGKNTSRRFSRAARG